MAYQGELIDNKFHQRQFLLPNLAPLAIVKKHIQLKAVTSQSSTTPRPSQRVHSTSASLLNKPKQQILFKKEVTETQPILSPGLKTKNENSSKDRQITFIKESSKSVLSSRDVDLNRYIKSMPKKTSFYVEMLKIQGAHQRQYTEDLDKVKEEMDKEKKKYLSGDDGSMISKQYLLKQTRKMSNFNVHTNFKISDDSERKDLVTLQKWMDNLTEQLFAKKFDFLRDFYSNLESIYSGCVQELVVLIGVKFYDHAQFLDKIWSTFCSITNDIIDKQSVRSNQVETEGLVEATRLHKLYQETLNDRTTRLNAGTTQLKYNEQIIDRMQKENKYLRRKDKRLEQDLNVLKSDHELLQMRFDELQKETQTLQLFQEDKGNHSKNGDIYKGTEINLEEEIYRNKIEIFDHFKQVFQDQTRKMEETYQRKKRELIIDDDPLVAQDEFQEDTGNEILFAHKNVGTSDEVHFATVGVSTREQKYQQYDDSCFTYTDKEIQATDNKKMRSSECQTYPQTENRETQIDMKVLRRESKPRNQLEKLFLQYSREPIKAHLDSYGSLMIPLRHLDTLDEYNITVMLQQYNALCGRLNETFGILKFKEEVFTEDYLDVNEYVKNSYTIFIDVIYQLWDRMKFLVQEMSDRKIILYESQLDIQLREGEIKAQKIVFEKLYEKYKISLGQTSYLERIFIDISRFIPQSTLDELQKGFKKHNLFKKLKLNSKEQKEQYIQRQSTIATKPFQLPTSDKKNEEDSPRVKLEVPIQHSDEDQIESNAEEDHEEVQQIQLPMINILSLTEVQGQGQNTIPLIPSSNRVKSEVYDLEDEPSFIKEDEIDFNLDLVLNPIKSLMTFEKKIFLSRCQSKFTSVATKAYQEEFINFRRDKIEGIMKQQTLFKVLLHINQFILKKITQYCKENYSYHVISYEFFMTENSLQGKEIWTTKYQRFIRNLIYYRKKNTKIDFICQMIQGDVIDKIQLKLPLFPYIFLLSKCYPKGAIISNQQETITQVQEGVLYSAIEQLYAHYSISPNQGEEQMFQQNSTTLIDYDVKILKFMQKFTVQKEQMLFQKYKTLLSIFSEDLIKPKINQNQIFVLFTKLENDKYIKNPDFINNLFKAECDQLQNGVKYLTCSRFTLLCEEYQLFSKETLAKYVLNNNDDTLNDMMVWKKEEKHLKMMLIKSKKYQIEQRQQFQKITELILYKDKQNDQSLKKILLKKIVEFDAKSALVDSEASDCIPALFQFFGNLECLMEIEC